MAEKNNNYRPSEEFKEAVINGSSIIIDCQFCGRTHFTTDRGEGDFQEGELEDLLKKHAEDPDKYFAHSSSPYWGYLDGKQYVVDCPCNSGSKYERLFWSHRHLIQKYFSERAKKIEKDSKNAAKLSKAVSEDVNKLG